MVHSYGYKSGTRHLFQKKFRQAGMPNTTTTLKTFKVGEYVDVVADAAIRRGMPHKYYHGRTGIVWNITPRGVGVIVNKPVGNRTLRKRICVRHEHVQKSRCREAFQKKLQNYRDFKKAKKDGKAVAAPKSRRAKSGVVRKPHMKTLNLRFTDFRAIYQGY